MLRGEAHRVLGPDDGDVEGDPYSPVITPLSLQRYSGQENDYAQFVNDKPPRWSHPRPRRSIRTSLVRLFAPFRSLLCPTTARTVVTIGLLMFMLCFAFCIKKPLFTSVPHPGTESQKEEPAHRLPVENPIFKVGSILFQARNGTDTFIL